MFSTIVGQNCIPCSGRFSILKWFVSCHKLLRKDLSKIFGTLYLDGLMIKAQLLRWPIPLMHLVRKRFSTNLTCFTYLSPSDQSTAIIKVQLLRWPILLIHLLCVLLALSSMHRCWDDQFYPCVLSGRDLFEISPSLSLWSYDQNTSVAMTRLHLLLSTPSNIYTHSDQFNWRSLQGRDFLKISPSFYLFGLMIEVQILRWSIPLVYFVKKRFLPNLIFFFIFLTL